MVEKGPLPISKLRAINRSYPIFPHRPVISHVFDLHGDQSCLSGVLDAEVKPVLVVEPRCIQTVFSELQSVRIAAFAYFSEVSRKVYLAFFKWPDSNFEEIIASLSIKVS